MAAQRLDGKKLADALQTEIGAEVHAALKQRQRPPCLAAVLVGDDPASRVYVRNKQRACRACRIDSQLHHLPRDARTPQLLELVARLNQDPTVDGILVQLPLPEHIDATQVLDLVSPLKDVDCFHPENVGLLVQGRPRFLPCTPHGCLQLLQRNALTCAGKHVVVVGRSDIVGKPLANMLLQRSLPPLLPHTVNATVTCCHSRTPDLADVLRAADVVVAAVGRPELITADMIRPGAIVIDVGINRVGDRLVGDVHFDSVALKAGWISPVPGGVGPLTVTMLLFNTLQAARLATPA